jgi:acyl carrier protein
MNNFPVSVHTDSENIKFTNDDFQGISTVSDVVALIEEKKKG